MPLKPMSGLSIRRSKPRTRAQKKAKTQAQIREEREKNLAKARRKRAKNLREAKKLAKR